MDRTSPLLVYRASAGAGKTYTLALKYIATLLRSAQAGASRAYGQERMAQGQADFYAQTQTGATQGKTVVQEANAHRHILAVTFTKDATNEMKERILAELYGLAYLPNDANSSDFRRSIREELPDMRDEDITRWSGDILTNILQDYGRFHVTTIDSFFQLVLRGLARELGVNSRFNIELDTELTIQAAVKAVIEKATQSTSGVLGRILRYLQHKLEDSDRWNIEGELQRFARQLFQEAFQEKEYTQPSAEEIKRIQDECRTIKDNFELQISASVQRFDTYCADYSLTNSDFTYGKTGTLGYFNKLRKGAYNEQPNTFLQKILDGKKALFKDEKRDATELMQLITDTEAYREKHLKAYNSSILVRKSIYQLELIKDIADEIDSQSNDAGRFMLAHTALLLSGMIEDSDTPFIYEKLGTEIRHIVIDEFQDTSTLQWRNFKVLLREALSKDQFCMLVGDVKQSIYRWRNGNWAILNNIEEDAELSAKIAPRTLDTNYRSAPTVVNFNNLLFDTLAKSLPYSSETGNNPFTQAYKYVKQKTKPGQEDKSQGYVSIEFCAKKSDEGDDYKNVVLGSIAERIHTLFEQGVEPADITILCRTNQEIQDIAGKLPHLYAALYDDDGEPLRIISEKAYQLAASPLLRQIISALHYISTPYNPIYLEELTVDTDYSFEEIKSLLEPIRRQRHLSVLSLVQELCCLFRSAEQPAQSAYLYAFMDGLTRFLMDNVADLNLVLNYWHTTLFRQTVPVPASRDARGGHILLMTIHKSKGLEFHTVIVPYCDGVMSKPGDIIWCTAQKNPPRPAPFNLSLLPIAYVQSMEHSYFKVEYDRETEAQWMDNLNVLYVAFTRARNNLIILSKQPNEKSASFTIERLLRDTLQMDFYEEGTLIPSTTEAKREDSETETATQAGKNPFREVEVENVATVFDPQKTTVRFKQTTGAQRFVQSEEEAFDSSYIKEGNLIHRIFEQIVVRDDITQAVTRLVEAGIVESTDKERLIAKVGNYISAAGRDGWFSGQYKVLNECTILAHNANAEAEQRRCDRVMLNEETQTAIVVDYKTGVARDEHTQQMREYMDLLRGMGYRTVEGYLWYLNEHNVLSVTAG